MNFLENVFDEWQLYEWETIIGDWFFIASIAFLAFELLRQFFKKTLTTNILGDILDHQKVILECLN